MKLAHRIFRTANGMEALLIKRPEEYTVGFSLLINAGSIYESEKISGISHFYEHLFFTGTKKYSTEEILRRRMQEIGLNVGARTWHDRIQIYGSFPKEETQNSLLVLKEMAFESLLLPEMIQKERGIILDEERLRQDNNYVKLWNIGYANRFKNGCSLQLPIEGRKETISAITRAQLLRFYRMHCVPANAKFVVGSSISFSKLEELMGNIFGSLPKSKKIKMPFLTNSDMTNLSIATVNKQNQQLYFLLSFPSYAGNDLYKAWQYGFVMEILYEELNKVLRIERGLVYDLGASGTRLTRNTAFSYVQSACDAENLEEILEAIFQKITSLREGNIDMVMFERLRDTGNKTLPMSFDSLSGSIDWCENSFYQDGKIYSPEYVLKVRNKVTKEDLQKAAKVLFDYKKLNIVVLGPLQKGLIDSVASKYV
jgi:predicted Zn-dependent peptidase